MKSSLRKCTGCGRYSLKDNCPECDSPTSVAHPAKYSPDDRYGAYRRKSLKEEYGENGKCHD